MPEWKDYQQELQRVYNNADTQLHGMHCNSVDIMRGKCLAIKEVFDIEKMVARDIIPAIAEFDVPQ